MGRDDMSESGDTEVEWLVKMAGNDHLELWDWRAGPPMIEQMCPVRQPKSSVRNRHVVVWVYSQTTRSRHLLESGLEHDLLRKLDRDPDVVDILAQPVELVQRGVGGFKHIPDLLTRSGDGTITVWDARADDRRDRRFVRGAQLSESACRTVGWRYQTFAGLDTTERMNLIWLHSSRTATPRVVEGIGRVLDHVRAGPVVLGDLLLWAQRGGDVRATVWYLMWRGDLRVDLTSKMTSDTCVSWSPRHA